MLTDPHSSLRLPLICTQKPTLNGQCWFLCTSYGPLGIEAGEANSRSVVGRWYGALSHRKPLCPLQDGTLQGKPQMKNSIVE